MTFPRLMETRAICAINYVTVEWHDIPESLPLDVEAYDGTRVEIRSVAEGRAAASAKWLQFYDWRDLKARRWGGPRRPRFLSIARASACVCGRAREERDPPRPCAARCALCR